jgi:hypothetical protein
MCFDLWAIRFMRATIELSLSFGLILERIVKRSMRPLILWAQSKFLVFEACFSKAVRLRKKSRSRKSEAKNLRFMILTCLRVNLSNRRIYYIIVCIIFKLLEESAEG